MEEKVSMHACTLYSVVCSLYSWLTFANPMHIILRLIYYILIVRVSINPILVFLCPFHFAYLSLDRDLQLVNNSPYYKHHLILSSNFAGVFGHFLFSLGWPCPWWWAGMVRLLSPSLAQHPHSTIGPMGISAARDIWFSALLQSLYSLHCILYFIEI